MTKLLNQYGTTNGTNLIVETICLSAGCMTESLNLAVGVSVVTTRANMSGVTFLSASRLGNYSLVIVTNSIFTTSEFDHFFAN